MKFPSPLTPCTLLRRYKRFLADVRFPDGHETTVHCPNPGAMLGLTPTNSPAWVSLSPNTGRKLPHTLELVEANGGLVGINTNHPNAIAAEALAAGRIAALKGPGNVGRDVVRREVRYGKNSRIDLLIEAGDAPATYVEVKNVHLMRSPGLAEFPDCVTARGAKHLKELSDVRAAGARAVMLFIVQRMDCTRFRPAGDLDPAYHAALRSAVAAGVETMCYDCDITPDGITLRHQVPVVLD